MEFIASGFAREAADGLRCGTLRRVQSPGFRAGVSNEGLRAKDINLEMDPYPAPCAGCRAQGLRLGVLSAGLKA